ncbi:hypothetical protein BgiBS90_028120, partial [Biomphalaria glabrata]
KAVWLESWSFIIILCCFYKAVSTLELAAIKKCDDDGTLVIGYGQTLLVCCELRPSECRKMVPSDSLFLSHLNQSLHLSNKTSGQCRVQLRVASVSQEHRGKLVCAKNNSTIMRRELNLLGPPNITYLSSSEKGDIIIKFTNLTNGFLYDVLLEARKLVTVLCSLNCSSDLDCICRYTNKKNDIISDQNLTIRINVFKSRDQPLTTITLPEKINFVHFVRPMKVENLKVWNLTSNEAVVQFQIPKETNVVKNYLKGKHISFFYQVLLEKSKGTLQSLKLQFPEITQLTSLESVTLRFKNLTSFTRYTLSVRGLSKGGEGDANSLTFTTYKSVPLKRPEIDAYGFTRFARINGSNCLFLIWKPLPDDYIGGVTLSYNVELLAEDLQYKMSTTLTYLKTCPVSRSNITAYIQPVNEVGPSLERAMFSLPETSLHKPTLYIEYNEDADHVTALVQVSSLSEAQDVALHWCVTQRDVSPEDFCTVYPETEIFSNVSFRSQKYLTFNLTTSRKEKVVSTSHDVPVEYFLNGDLNQSDFTIGKLSIINSYGQNRREITTHGQDIPNTITRLTGQNLPEKSDLIFLFSFKKNTDWMGMSPAECYFTAFTRDVQLSIKTEVTSDSKVTVQLKQMCGNEKHFLARYFQLYWSVNEDCKSNSSQTSLVESFIFEAATVQLPLGSNFLCVVAVGVNGIRSKPFSSNIAASSGSQGSEFMIVLVVAPFLVVIVAFCFLSIFFTKCRNRRGYFKELTNTPEVNAETGRECYKKDMNLRSSAEVRSDSSAVTSCSFNIDRANDSSVERQPESRLLLHDGFSSSDSNDSSVQRQPESRLLLHDGFSSSDSNDSSVQRQPESRLLLHDGFSSSDSNYYSRLNCSKLSSESRDSYSSNTTNCRVDNTSSGTEFLSQCEIDKLSSSRSDLNSLNSTDASCRSINKSPTRDNDDHYRPQGLTFNHSSSDSVYNNDMDI